MLSRHKAATWKSTQVTPASEHDARPVIFLPDAHLSLQRGIETLARPLAATLGPLGRTVVISQARSDLAPELLADAGTIAQRVTELPDRHTNVGAMLLRDLAWRMRQEVGDGSATAAVLLHSMVGESVRVVAAGANPISVTQGMERGVNIVVQRLAEMARPLNSQATIASLIRSAIGNDPLVNIVAEVFDNVGADATVVVEEYQGVMTDREYVEGIRWDTGLASLEFVTDTTRQEAVMTNPVIALVDARLSTAAQVVPILQRATETDGDSVVIIAMEIEGEALGTLFLNKQKSKMDIAPIRAPGLVLSRPEIMKDLAILTGGTLPDEKVGLRLDAYRAQYFGRARRVLATRRNFTIVGAKGRQRDIRARMVQLKEELDQEGAETEANTLRKRLANLSGGIAILKIGAPTEEEGKLKRKRTEEAIRVVKSAMDEGTVAGGGAAYLACIPSLEAAAQATRNADEAAGIHIVAHALSAPLQQIVANAGYEGPTIAARLADKRGSYGFDVISGEIVDMMQAQIVDPVKVLRLALQLSASTARMVLTTSAVVSTKKEG